MAQLPRKFQRIFAETAGTDEVGVVGSRASGTPTTSKDLDVIQSNNRFVQGWFLTTVRQTLTGGVLADLPASEDFNGLLFLLTSQLQYLFQNGIPEWLDDADQRYYENVSFVQVNGDVYQAIQGDDGANINAQQNPTTSPDWWRLIWSRTSTAFYRAIVGAETINLTAGTPPKFIEVTGGTPFTLTLNGFVSPPGSPLVIYNNTTADLTLAGSSSLSDTLNAGDIMTAYSGDNFMIRQVIMSNSGQQLLREDNANSLLRLSFATWTRRQAFTSDVIAMTFGNDLFVLGLSTGNSIWTSPDGITWTERQTLDGPVTSLTFGNDLFVAGTTTGNSVWTSPDGITWTEQQTLDGPVEVLTFGNNLYVAGTFSPGESIWTSPDGITWTEQQTLNAPPRALTFGNNLYVVAASDAGARAIWTSPDGATWTQRQTFTNDIRGLTFGNNLYVLGDTGSGSSFIWTSTDAITWTQQQELVGPGIIRLTFGSNLFVAGTGLTGGGGSMWDSSDGINWTERQAVDGQVRALTFGNEIFVIGTQGDTVWSTGV